jgi:hypothetical protein
MDQHARALLQVFARACSNAVLQSDDWQKLYDLVLYVHQHRVVSPTRMVREYLVTQGCSLQKASFLSNQYDRLHTILRLYDEQRSRTAKS